MSFSHLFRCDRCAHEVVVPVHTVTQFAVPTGWASLFTGNFGKQRERLHLCEVCIGEFMGSKPGLAKAQHNPGDPRQ